MEDSDPQPANRISSLQQAQRPQKMRIEIKGPTGSVRGHLGGVMRMSLENVRAVARSNRRNFGQLNLVSFCHSSSKSKRSRDESVVNQDGTDKSEQSSKLAELMQLESRFYLEDLILAERHKCVLYTTSLAVIRRTFNDSKMLRTNQRSMLTLNLIAFEERDVYLNQEFREQLRLRVGAIKLPSLFVRGKLIGGLRELELLNEEGTLSIRLAKFKMPKLSSDICSYCGNARFVACQNCNGSRKSQLHHFKFSSVALRCIKCDQNDGLVQCEHCFGHGTNDQKQQEDTWDSAEYDLDQLAPLPILAAVTEKKQRQLRFYQPIAKVDMTATRAA